LNSLQLNFFVAVENSPIGASFAKTLLVKIKNFLLNLPLHIGRQQKIDSKHCFKFFEKLSTTS
jgi:hypothetical protein